jgi:carbon-monoxide dehydrogenase small subunit
MITVRMSVNGTVREASIAPHRPLLEVLRDELGLTGTKECCAVGECGACTVIVDGRAVNSCLVLAVEADGASVTTVEGLAGGGGARLSPLQEAFLEHGAVQCGFCIPGMLMSAHYLLEANPTPSVEAVREGLSGNLCRCAGYNRIVAAVLAAAGASRPSAGNGEDRPGGVGGVAATAIAGTVDQ